MTSEPERPRVKIDVIEQSATELAEYGSVPIGFTVDRVFDIEDDPSGGFVLTERVLDRPYVKDYDVIEGPATWAQQFSLAKWALFVARVGGRRVGGAVVAMDTAEVTMLEGRSDLGVLWDIRVSPDVRGHGVGSALLRAAERCAAGRGCRELKIETQNINVVACRFYERRGYRLQAVDRNAYPMHKDEIQMLWTKSLA